MCSNRILRPGTVQHVSDVLDPLTHTVKVRATVPNPEHRLKPDMFATVEFAQPQGTRLKVPSQAVVQDNGHDAVIVVGQQDVFTLRPVQLGAVREGRHSVLVGLEPNERIVTLGAPFILQTMQD
jgi:cobalt-zinc-cadmium efflux system membrane fusion protein